MVRLIRPADFTPARWKNGGGITHEIAAVTDAHGPLWRLSIAEVASDGPFSTFAGLSRILTVIKGAGLILETPDGRLQAKPLVPLVFSGDTPVSSRMLRGPIRDFNLIYDAGRIKTSVAVSDSLGGLAVEGANDRLVILLLGGGLHVGDISACPGDVVVLDDPAAKTAADRGSTGIVVRLHPHA